MQPVSQDDSRLAALSPGRQEPAGPQPGPPLNLVTQGGLWLMQVKDTIQIGLMLYSGALVFGVVFGVGIPGLILYGLRWRQLRRGGQRWNNLVMAALGLLHEIVWAVNFPLDDPPHDPTSKYERKYDIGDIIFHGDVLRSFYWVGAALMLLVLVAGLWPPGPSRDWDGEQPQ